MLLQSDQAIEEPCILHVLQWPMGQLYISFELLSLLNFVVALSGAYPIMVPSAVQKEKDVTEQMLIVLLPSSA